MVKYNKRKNGYQIVTVAEFHFNVILSFLTDLCNNK